VKTERKKEISILISITKNELTTGLNDGHPQSKCLSTVVDGDNCSQRMRQGQHNKLFKTVLLCKWMVWALNHMYVQGSNINIYISCFV
jgi:hypothetical protein